MPAPASATPLAPPKQNPPSNLSTSAEGPAATNISRPAANPAPPRPAIHFPANSKRQLPLLTHLSLRLCTGQSLGRPSLLPHLIVSLPHSSSLHQVLPHSFPHVRPQCLHPLPPPLLHRERSVPLLPQMPQLRRNARLGKLCLPRQLASCFLYLNYRTQTYRSPGFRNLKTKKRDSRRSLSYRSNPAFVPLRPASRIAAYLLTVKTKTASIPRGRLHFLIANFYFLIPAPTPSLPRAFPPSRPPASALSGTPAN